MAFFIHLQLSLMRAHQLLWVKRFTVVRDVALLRSEVGFNEFAVTHDKALLNPHAQTFLEGSERTFYGIRWR